MSSGRTWAASRPDAPQLCESGLADFVAALNAAAPGLALRPDEVLRVFTGLLPATAPATARLATRCVFVDHVVMD